MLHVIGKKGNEMFCPKLSAARIGIWGQEGETGLLVLQRFTDFVGAGGVRNVGRRLLSFCSALLHLQPVRDGGTQR